MLRTDKQTDGLENPTHADRIIKSVKLAIDGWIANLLWIIRIKPANYV